MPRQKPFDKRTATTYALVNRPQHDPRIYDEDAPSQVFTEISAPSSSRRQAIKQRGDLEEEFGLSGQLKQIRANEGEAAEHGIFYDDSSYDYMQHLREIGTGGGETTWVEAPAAKAKSKDKSKLEDAIRDIRLDVDDTASVSGSSVAGSYIGARNNDYERQQDIPDELRGFQPDMDPRLREVLEALEDDAYVDYEDDIFAELAGDGGEEVDKYEWEATGQDYYVDEGWESDDTTKPVKEYRQDRDADVSERSSAEEHLSEVVPPAPELEAGDLMASITKSKGLPEGDLTQRKKVAAPPSSIALTTDTNTGRRKKRKGALTSSTGFSMSSSALARTEPLSLLDSRFDKLAEQYMGDLDEEDEADDGMSLASGATGMSRASKWGGSQVSQAPSLVSANFESAGLNSVMDSFLASNGEGKGRRMKKAGRTGFWAQQSGMEQLDEIRAGLGPARLRQKG